MWSFIILFLSLVFPNQVSAQYTDEALYAAYLKSDVSLWKEYIEHTDWNSLSKNEKKRLLNYQYGYVAFAVSEQDESAEHHLQLFAAHIEEMGSDLEAAQLACYRSSLAAYEMSMNTFRKLMYANRAMTYANEAMRLDSLHPAALTLKANIDMYCPKAFGGNKERALRYFLLAEQRFRELNLTLHNWNYRALQLCIAQCYEKTGDKQKAIEKCEQILKEEPAFSYISEIYLPTLRGETINPKVGIGNVGNIANSVL